MTSLVLEVTSFWQSIAMLTLAGDVGWMKPKIYVGRMYIVMISVGWMFLSSMYLICKYIGRVYLGRTLINPPFWHKFPSPLSHETFNLTKVQMLEIADGLFSNNN